MDRNFIPSRLLWEHFESPSSRRAWIEITLEASYLIIERVALLAEGVDRNKLEIVVAPTLPLVALLAEGVDRNALSNVHMGQCLRRPPRGGRG